MRVQTISVMHKETILDHDQSTVWFYPEEKIVHHQFKGNINGDAFQNTLNASAEIFEAYRCQKYLSDDRLNTGVDQADVQWAISEWNPRVLACGWRFWAIVKSSTESDPEMDKVIEAYERINLKVQLFEDPTEALEWLKQQN